MSIEVNFFGGRIMGCRLICVLTFTVLLTSIFPAVGRASDIGWPEAVGRLAGERSKAETCAALLKGYGDQPQISRGQLAYADAKAKIDGAIAELLVALSEGGNPKGISSIDADLEQGASGLVEFCKMVSGILPDTAGQRGILADIVKGAVEPVINALSEAIAALYNYHRTDDALTRETIKTQLEAVRWPNFTEVKAAN
jgi:hypothetical protein